jgi:hypothetical protein
VWLLSAHGFEEGVEVGSDGVLESGGAWVLGLEVFEVLLAHWSRVLLILLTFLNMLKMLMRMRRRRQD